MTEKIVRLAGTDLEGEKKVAKALRKIKGINHAMADAITSFCSISKERKIGELDKDEIETLKEIIENPKKKLPDWLLNRRRDLKKGETTHHFGGKVDITEKMDIKRMKEIKSYKGLRHARGLPVRGQKTQSTGRGKSSVGVQRKKIQAEKRKEKRGEEE